MKMNYLSGLMFSVLFLTACGTPEPQSTPQPSPQPMENEKQPTSTNNPSSTTNNNQNPANNTNSSIFSNHRVDMRIVYENDKSLRQYSGNPIFESNLSFEIQKDNSITGTWYTPYGKYSIIGKLTGVTLAQNNACINEASKYDVYSFEENAKYTAAIITCTEKNANFNQNQTTFSIMATDTNDTNIFNKQCYFGGELIKNKEQLIINSITTSCLDFDSNIIYTSYQDISYSVDGLAWTKTGYAVLNTPTPPNTSVPNNNYTPSQTAVNPNPLPPVTNTYTPPQTNEPVAPVVGAPSANTMNGGGFFSCPPTVSC